MMFKRELLANKLYAILIMAIGIITVLVSKDMTAAVFLFMVAVPLFLAKENYIK